MTDESPSLVRQLLDEWHRTSVDANESEPPLEGMPLIDSDDQDVVMHRDIHFGGSFPIMIEYYESDGKGAVLDIKRIRHLAELEHKIGHNLGILCLTEAEMEQVARAKAVYKRLKELCEAQPKPTRARLIADLILAESNEEDTAIKGVINAGPPIIPELARLLKSHEFARSLAPGYGFAPVLAAKCLGEIGHPNGVIPLFEAIGHIDEEIDHAAIAALAKLGTHAQEFLLSQLSGGTITPDTERAAAALAVLPSDPIVSRRALELLGDVALWRHPNLTGYLAMCCGGLSTADERAQLEALAKEPGLPQVAREEIEYWLPQISPEG